MEPGSSRQSGDRAAHMRLGAPEPPAQGPLRDPTPGPDRTPDPRTVSKSVAKAPAHPTHCRQNPGTMRFHLDHPDPAAAFATDLDNPQPPSTIHSPTAPDPRPPTSPVAPDPEDRLDVLGIVLGRNRPDIHLDLGLGQTGQVGDRLAHLVLNLIEAAAPGRPCPRRGLQHPPVAAPPFGCHREYPSHRHHPFLT